MTSALVFVPNEAVNSVRYLFNVLPPCQTSDESNGKVISIDFGEIIITRRREPSEMLCQIANDTKYTTTSLSNFVHRQYYPVLQKLLYVAYNLITWYRSIQCVIAEERVIDLVLTISAIPRRKLIIIIESIAHSVTMLHSDRANIVTT